MEEAHYYFCVATLTRSFINNIQVDVTCSSYIKMISDPVNKLIIQMYVESSSSDFSLILSNASSIMNLMADSIIAKSSEFEKIVTYGDVFVFSNFLQKLKEIVFILYVKFKVINLKSLNSIQYNKELFSKFALVKNIFIAYSDDLIIECDDHSTLINSFICWFDQLDAAIKTFLTINK